MALKAFTNRAVTNPNKTGNPAPAHIAEQALDAASNSAHAAGAPRLGAKKPASNAQMKGMAKAHNSEVSQTISGPGDMAEQGNARKTNSGENPKLNDGERETMRALSALQIRYGQAVEAVPYLLMIRRTNPEDLEAARLLALAFMKLKKWEEAELVLAEIEQQARDKKSEGWFALLPLYRGLSAFKTRKFEQAKRWLSLFRKAKRSAS